jgi:hypothetical protein
MYRSNQQQESCISSNNIVDPWQGRIRGNQRVAEAAEVAEVVRRLGEEVDNVHHVMDPIHVPHGKNTFQGEEETRSEVHPR